MFYDVSLYISLSIFGLGLIYKISTWFVRSIGINSNDINTSTRVLAAIKGVFGSILSAKIFTLIRVFIVDVLFQARILKEDYLRWVMHMFIFWGFMLLLLMHAMDSIITEPLFSEYASTLNPFMFLRDLFGLLVIIGIGIAICRRFILKVPRLNTNAMDHYAIIILAIIMLSGVFLEGLKITSFTKYQEMVEEYAGIDDEDELRALESLWVAKFDVVSPNVKGPFDEEILEQGKELHEMGCASCHSLPIWAFTGYAVAKITKPFALGLDRANIHNLFWYIHFLACFFGLAYLPFSKMFHIFASPVSLLVNSVADRGRSAPANIATIQVMELDACTHCGTCSLRCSVAVALNKIDNINILPSEKMVFLKAYASKKDLDDEGLKAIQEGIYLCTNCDRCTVVCPSGINLRDLWFSVREEFIREGPSVPLVLSPFSFYRGLNQQDLAPDYYKKPLDEAQRVIAEKCELMNKPDKVVPLTPINKEFKNRIDISSQSNTYSYCFSCENCTTVCPVVENYENPQDALGLLPHQIMRSVGLGLTDLSIGSNMLWNCLTCYQCQEHCPQGVKVTDIFYELKNLAINETHAA